MMAVSIHSLHRSGAASPRARSSETSTGDVGENDCWWLRRICLNIRKVSGFDLEPPPFPSLARNSQPLKSVSDAEQLLSTSSVAEPYNNVVAQLAGSERSARLEEEISSAITGHVTLSHGDILSRLPASDGVKRPQTPDRVDGASITQVTSFDASTNGLSALQAVERSSSTTRSSQSPYLEDIHNASSTSPLVIPPSFASKNAGRTQRLPFDMEALTNGAGKPSMHLSLELCHNVHVKANDLSLYNFLSGGDCPQVDQNGVDHGKILYYENDRRHTRGRHGSNWSIRHDQTLLTISQVPRTVHTTKRSAQDTDDMDVGLDYYHNTIDQNTEKTNLIVSRSKSAPAGGSNGGKPSDSSSSPDPSNGGSKGNNSGGQTSYASSGEPSIPNLSLSTGNEAGHGGGGQGPHSGSNFGAQNTNTGNNHQGSTNVSSTPNMGGNQAVDTSANHATSGNGPGSQDGTNKMTGGAENGNISPPNPSNNGGPTSGAKGSGNANGSSNGQGNAGNASGGNEGGTGSIAETNNGGSSSGSGIRGGNAGSKGTGGGGHSGNQNGGGTREGGERSNGGSAGNTNGDGKGTGSGGGTSNRSGGGTREGSQGGTGGSSGSAGGSNKGTGNGGGKTTGSGGNTGNSGGGNKRISNGGGGNDHNGVNDNTNGKEDNITGGNVKDKGSGSNGGTGQAGNSPCESAKSVAGGKDKGNNGKGDSGNSSGDSNGSSDGVGTESVQSEGSIGASTARDSSATFSQDSTTTANAQSTSPASTTSASHQHSISSQVRVITGPAPTHAPVTTSGGAYTALGDNSGETQSITTTMSIFTTTEATVLTIVDGSSTIVTTSSVVRTETTAIGIPTLVPTSTRVHSSNTRAIVGATVSAVAFALIAMFLVFCCLRRRRRARNNPPRLYGATGTGTPWSNANQYSTSHIEINMSHTTETDLSTRPRASSIPSLPSLFNQLSRSIAPAFSRTASTMSSDRPYSVTDMPNIRFSDCSPAPTTGDPLLDNKSSEENPFADPQLPTNPFDDLLAVNSNDLRTEQRSSKTSSNRSIHYGVAF
ncbi:hypothetical protein AX17_000112 [Amanita inopinata Kibby_2008]|nr:hypothetical protein AX17_000112 [Amanita inopinata Kibby_2008]